MSVRSRDVITTAVRIVTFIVTMIPLAALFTPWVTLDGSVGTRSGAACIALLASPVREYLFAVDLVQTAVVTLGPALILLLSVVTSSYYYRLRSIFWAPVGMLALALATIYLTANLVSFTHLGPHIVVIAAVLILLHQGAIRLQLATRRNSKLSWLSGPLATGTGMRRA